MASPQTSRQVRYGVAASLDGYIAGPNGEADWITTDPEIDFAQIWSRFDTLLIGRKTFVTMVKPGQQAPSMPGVKTVVFSRTLDAASYPGVTIVRDRAAESIAEMKASPGKDIWLFGGGELFTSLANLGLVDSVSVALMPVMLGAGRPLFPASARRLPLQLVRQQVYKHSGIVSLEYQVVSKGKSRPRPARGKGPK
jgi:dihydrofolate reductase